MIPHLKSFKCEITASKVTAAVVSQQMFLYSCCHFIAWVLEHCEDTAPTCDIAFPEKKETFTITGMSGFEYCFTVTCISLYT